MKRRLKKMFLLVSIFMITMLLLNISENNAVAADKTTITIKKGSTITVDWSGMNVTAYQVLKLANDVSNSKKLYTVTEDFKSFFDIAAIKNAFNGSDPVYLGYDSQSEKLVTATTESKGYFNIKNNTKLDEIYSEADLITRIEGSDNLSIFYSWIEKYIEAKKSFNRTITAEATSDPSLIISDIEHGYYALTFSKVHDGISVKQGILIATTDDGASIEIKAENIFLKKLVKNINKSTTDYSKTATANIGDKLAYQITSRIPYIVDYDNLSEYTFSDTLSNQILDNKSFKLYIGKDETTYSDSTIINKFMFKGEDVATLSIGEAIAGKQTFTLDFNTSFLEGYEDEDIILTYETILNYDVVQVNENNIVLTYINGPDIEEITDKTEVYTYGIEIQKTFSDGTTDYGDIKFNLCTHDSSSNSPKEKLTLYGANGSYKKSDNAIESTELELNSTTGKLTITGLDEGTYWLVESKTKEGFNLSEPIQIVLKSKDDIKKELDDTYTTAKYNGQGDSILEKIIKQDSTSINLAKITVLNQKGFSLPNTGGMGTWMFTLSGIVLITIAATLFLYSINRRFK